MSTLEAVRYKRGELTILNQLLLPHVSEFLHINTLEDAFDAIRSMKVRGAPAIAIVGALSLAIELHRRQFATREDLVDFCHKGLDYLVESRPTAVNMRTAAQRLRSTLEPLLADDVHTTEQIKQRIIEEAEAMLAKDVQDNMAIGENGARDLLLLNREKTDKLNILTICNTGSLATAGYGTALGVIRSLHAAGNLEHVYFCETRPFNQGSRLTAYELLAEKIPATLICDSAAGWLMATRAIHGVVTGADRVAANGDSANKIGTYMLAVLAKHHNIPFYIAAPMTTFDVNMASGKDIVVEERDWTEMTMMHGKRVAAEGVTCWNPAFDITPHHLITGGIITEKGVIHPSPP